MAAAPAIIAGVAAVAGTTATVISNNQAAAAQAKAARRDQELKNQQAQEILTRANINSRALRKQRDDLIFRQISGLAAGNAALSGSALQTLNETAGEFELLDLNLKREANYRAAQLKAGADFSGELQSDIYAANKLQNTATFLTGATNLGLGLSRAGAFDQNTKK